MKVGTFNLSGTLICQEVVLLDKLRRASGSLIFPLPHPLIFVLFCASSSLTKALSSICFFLGDTQFKQGDLFPLHANTISVLSHSLPSNRNK